MGKLAYQIQRNGTKHLIEMDEKGKATRFLPFRPNLDIPVVKSYKWRKQIQQPQFPLEGFANKN